MQYKVPQNVGIEDKIVGPLTLRQLIILAVGGGFSYLLFALMSKLYELNILEYIVILIPALIALVTALVRINDQSFTKFVLLFLEFSIKPKRRNWDHRGIADISDPDLSETKKETEKEAAPSSPSNVNLGSLSQMLDSGGFEHVRPIQHEDIDQVDDNYLVQQAFFGRKKDASAADNMYWRCKETHKARLNALAKQPMTQLKTKVKAKATQADAQAGAPKSAPVPAPAAAAAVAEKPAQPNADQKPSRRPVRKNTHVNTMKKNQPLQYQPKPAVKKPSSPAPASSAGQSIGTPAKKNALSQEISFEELKKGEIEINLDD